MPVTELNMQLIFCGLTLLFLPLFLASALFKVGNLANDGVKLSARKSACSSDIPLFEDDHNGSTTKSVWIHGLPISVFIHIITALCLLLPHLLLEAKLIQNQHLPKGKMILFRNLTNGKVHFAIPFVYRRQHLEERNRLYSEPQRSLGYSLLYQHFAVSERYCFLRKQQPPRRLGRDSGL